MNRFLKHVSIILSIIFTVSCRNIPSNEKPSQLKFYGADSKRAKMEFNTYVDFKIPNVDKNLDAEELSVKYNDEIDEAIRIQLAHMYGAFTVHTKPVNFYENPGIPREQPIIKISNVDRKVESGKLRISYSYEDIVVFKKSIFKSRGSTKISFYLPKEPGPHGLSVYQAGCPRPKEVPDFCNNFLDLEYQDSFGSSEEQEQFFACQKLTSCSGRNINYCTDHHYNDAFDFWYFWDPMPDDEKCPLTQNDIVKVNAVLYPLPSTVNTYPEYRKFLGISDSEEKTVRVTFLVGVDENFSRSDLGAKTFNAAYKVLTEGKALLSMHNLNFEINDKEREILTTTKDIRFTHAPGPYSNEPRHKVLRWQGDGYKVLLNMYLMDPTDTENLIKLSVDGLRNSDLFIYDGHSGLGGYFDVGLLFAKKRYTLYENTYQIFFFNGCSTFSYYNSDYFELKGTKNLDIMTNAIGAPFVSGAGPDVWLIRDLISGDMPSWQEMMNTLYEMDPRNTALTHVNGDEDNPHKPVD
jgi:hypothetical protein